MGEDHIIESAVSNSSGDDNNGNTKENQTQQEQCQDGTEVTDLLACPSKLRPVRPPTCLKQVYLSIKS